MIYENKRASFIFQAVNYGIRTSIRHGNILTCRNTVLFKELTVCTNDSQAFLSRSNPLKQKRRIPPLLKMVKKSNILSVHSRQFLVIWRWRVSLRVSWRSADIYHLTETATKIWFWSFSQHLSIWFMFARKTYT